MVSNADGHATVVISLGTVDVKKYSNHFADDMTIVTIHKRHHLLRNTPCRILAEIHLTFVCLFVVCLFFLLLLGA